MSIAAVIEKIRQTGFTIEADGDYIAIEPFDELTVRKPSALPSVICRAAPSCSAFCARMSDGDIEPLEAAH